MLLNSGLYRPTGQILRSVALRYRLPNERSYQSVFWGQSGGVRYRWLDLDTSPGPIADGPTLRSADLARLEAVLFLSREPLGSRKLAQLAGLADGTKARTLVRALNCLYDAENCAFRAVEVAGGFQLMSRAKFAPWLRRFHAERVEVRLSGPALETLAVVAYRQPTLRAEIEAIRGVQCGEILRQLMERDLVKIAGRSEELGRPFLYGTTKRFLQVFGLRHLDELPRLAWFRAEDSTQKQEDRQESTIPSSAIQEEFNVKCVADPQEVLEETAALAVVSESVNEFAQVDDEKALEDDDYEPGEDDDEYEDDEEYEYDDEDDDEYEDEDDEYEYEDEDDDEDEDEDEDEDDFEDEEWEEVEDDDEEDEEDEEDEDEDEEDWDDEDEDEEYEYEYEDLDEDEEEEEDLDDDEEED